MRRSGTDTVVTSSRAAVDYAVIDAAEAPQRQLAAITTSG
jgi:hypothetical protein